MKGVRIEVVTGSGEVATGPDDRLRVGVATHQYTPVARVGNSTTYTHPRFR